MCFQQEVSDPHQQKDHVGALELTAAMWPIHREAVTETTWGTDKKGRHIELTLTRTEARWPVTGIGGDALRQQPDDAVRANLLPGAPNPDL